jgi:hypothetical protein
LSNGVGWADSWNGVHSFLVFAPIGAFPEPFLTSIASRYDFGWSATSGGALQEGNSKFIYGTYYSATQGHHNFEWYLENHPDWILYGCDRASPMLQYSYSAVILDFTNPEVIDYKFDELVNGTAVAWDNFLLGNDITLPDGTTGHACGVYDQTGNWIQKFAGIGSYSEVKDPQWTDGMIAYASAIRQRLHDLPNPKLLIPNADVKVITGDPIRVANFIAAVDGVLVEGGQFGPSSLGDERLLWLRNIRLAEAMNNAGKAFYSLEYADWATSKGKTIVKDYIQFTLASYLLAKGHATAIDILPTLNYDDSDGIYWPAEFQAATEIGTPCAAMAQIGGIDGSEEGVFFREHSGGVSLVNSSRINWYVVDLSTTKSSYKDLYGNAVASLVVVRPISGLVLLKANEDGCSNSR